MICWSPDKQKSPKSPLRPCPPPFLREDFLKPAWCLESRELAHVTGVVLPGSTANGRRTQKTFLGSLHTTAEGGTHLPRGNHCDPSRCQHETGHKREYVRAASEHATQLLGLGSGSVLQVQGCGFSGRDVPACPRASRNRFGSTLCLSYDEHPSLLTVLQAARVGGGSGRCGDGKDRGWSEHCSSGVDWMKFSH